MGYGFCDSPAVGRAGSLAFGIFNELSSLMQESHIVYYGKIRKQNYHDRAEISIGRRDV